MGGGLKVLPCFILFLDISIGEKKKFFPLIKIYSRVDVSLTIGSPVYQSPANNSSRLLLKERKHTDVIYNHFSSTMA